MSRCYGQFCGLSRALDLLGGRWAFLVVRDLLVGPKRFTQLQEGLHGVPTNVLTARLRELEEAGIVQRRVQTGAGGGVVYELTNYGRELEEPLVRLGYWGAKSLGEPEEDDFISTDALALALRGAFRAGKARGRQRRYELNVSGKSLPIAVKGGQATVPASSVDAPDTVLEADAGVFAELFSGRTDVDTAIAAGRLRVHGDRADARRLFEMFRFPTAAEATVPA
jgi:DNA-binding HxlR family transcriptional regulator/putative sterol carrier protein